MWSMFVLNLLKLWPEVGLCSRALWCRCQHMHPNTNQTPTRITLYNPKSTVDYSIPLNTNTVSTTRPKTTVGDIIILENYLFNFFPLLQLITFPPEKPVSSKMDEFPKNIRLAFEPDVSLYPPFSPLPGERVAQLECVIVFVFVFVFVFVCVFLFDWCLSCWTISPLFSQEREWLNWNV